MTQHDYLMERIAQHKPKNDFSKFDDKMIKQVVEEVIVFLTEYFPGHTFEMKSQITIKEMAEYGQRTCPIGFEKRAIKPDGGIIWMDKKYPILISEMKRQGTNNVREKKQAVGNAIERFGKNVRALEGMYQYEKIFPLLCFCWGCDFAEELVQGKLICLNALYECNVEYGIMDKGIKPCNIFYQEMAWDYKSIFEKMSRFAILYAEYFLNKE